MQYPPKFTRPIYRWMAGLLFATVLSPAYADRCYVNVNATGLNNGSSWANAYINLLVAVKNSACSELWVAKGVYTPVFLFPNRNTSFTIAPGTAVYGGFAGNETLLTARNPALNLTVLSGDIDNDDVHSAGNGITVNAADIVGNNSYHVVTMDGTGTQPITNTTILDGLVITGGNADGDGSGAPFPNRSGGGLYCNGSGTGHNCSPTFNQLVFSGNRARNGGAMLNLSGPGGTSSPLISNSTFSGNEAIGDGGAVYNVSYSGGISSPLISNSTFNDNRAGFAGGAMVNRSGTGGTSSPIISNSTFSGNEAVSIGGAMSNDGSGMGTSSPVITNSTFNGNRADSSGGALYNGSSSGTSHTTLRNVILWQDTARFIDLEIYNAGGAMVMIDHSVFADACPMGSVCTNLITSDPLLSPLGNYGGLTATQLPATGSPVIDAGDDAQCTPNDQRGFSRVGTHCDVGAVERQVVEDLIFKNGFEKS